MLQELLKTKTTPLHNKLEQLMFVNDIMQRKLTLTQYKKLLITNYLIHAAYEENIFKNIEEAIAANLSLTARNKLNALSVDLANADLSSNDFIAIIKHTATIPNSAFAMGALYVLEGATLGGSVIVKQLLQNSNFDEDHQFNYYGVYGSDLIAKWQQFLKELNNLPKEKHNDVIEGANFMFNEIIKIALKVKNLDE